MLDELCPHGLAFYCEIGLGTATLPCWNGLGNAKAMHRQWVHCVKGYVFNDLMIFMSTDLLGAKFYGDRESSLVSFSTKKTAEKDVGEDQTVVLIVFISDIFVYACNV